MINKTIKMFFTLTLALLIASCEKIESPVVLGEQIDFTFTEDQIPLQYGRLVNVTPVGTHFNFLWFEQADQTIIGVKVNWTTGTVSEQIIRIERK